MTFEIKSNKTKDIGRLKMISRLFLTKSPEKVTVSLRSGEFHLRMSWSYSWVILTIENDIIHHHVRLDID